MLDRPTNQASLNFQGCRIRGELGFATPRVEEREDKYEEAGEQGVAMQDQPFSTSAGNTVMETSFIKEGRVKHHEVSKEGMKGSHGAMDSHPAPHQGFVRRLLLLPSAFITHSPPSPD